MKNPLINLKKEAYKLSLTRDEKRVMHANLMARMNASESMAPARSRPSPYFFFSPQLMMPMAALLVVVLVGSGTAYAAEGALPGDPLYVIKTKVAEPIQGALAFSAEDKIQFHSGVAQTRLEEAEVLASQNRLDAGASAELASNIDKHIAERQELADKLDEEKPGRGSEALARSSTSIAAHSDILVALGSESASSSVKEHSDSIAMSARGSRGRFGSASGTTLAMAAPTLPQPMAMKLSVAEDASSSSDEAPQMQNKKESLREDDRSNASFSGEKKFSKNNLAVSLGARATSTLVNLRAQAAAIADKIDTDTAGLLDARFAKIDLLIKDGSRSLAEGDYSAAKESFNEALDREVTLSAFITAGVQFDKGILKNLLGHDSRWGEDQ